jgi:hypothetical protein
MTFLSNALSSQNPDTDAADYDVYHDESLEGGYWHGMLLVPRLGRDELVGRLFEIRTNTGYAEPIALKRIRKATGARFRCGEAWVSLGVAALAQRAKGSTLPFRNGLKTPHPHFDRLGPPIGARFILFRVRDGLSVLRGYSDHASKVETTFRMGLKGGLHLFADHPQRLRVSSLHFDGYEHYRRRVDGKRIIDRIGQLRDEVSFAQDLLIDDRSGDHSRDGAQEYADCQLLQLTDLLVSGFRTVLGEARNGAQLRAAEPLGDLASRWHDGPARMTNSRWYKGFCISECYLEDDRWQFADIQRPVEERQAKLPGF